MTSFLRPVSSAAPQGFGKPVPRVEDARLIRGHGRYSDDVNVAGQVYAAFVEMPATPERVWRAIQDATIRP